MVDALCFHGDSVDTFVYMVFIYLWTVKFQALKAPTLQMAVFWVVVLCSVAILTLMVEAANT
jgi:hypothetical protein